MSNPFDMKLFLAGSLTGSHATPTPPSPSEGHSSGYFYSLAQRQPMDLAKKASRMSSKSPLGPARWIDALLLSSDHALARSSPRKILEAPLDR